MLGDKTGKSIAASQKFNRAIGQGKIHCVLKIAVYHGFFYPRFVLMTARYLESVRKNFSNRGF